ncbi:primosomal protein N' [bacterium BMS3Abin09]|nr:primosomal protein N' [bacterium BMS3Abin09]HDH34870.1 primosomal protein N' [Nitrospirota bacterium]
MFADIQFPINAEAFTYIVPDELEPIIKIGARVEVPFKRSYKTGIVTGFGKRPKDPAIKLKEIKSLLDEEPFLPKNILDLIKWVSEYYMSPSGLALKNIVPAAFFTGKKAGTPRIIYDPPVQKKNSFKLTPEQRKALDEINSVNEGVFLLHGVTGSGKTEVYINAVRALPKGKEALVLVPEIAITAQMIDRFRSNFGDDVVFYHSGISVGERITQWQKMRDGEVKIVIGVRSAVFAPFRNLGLIVVDEEQESSYKQFEGVRYNARDVALARAQLEKIKVVLGSATPSMEAYHAAMTGKFKYLELTERVSDRKMPDVEIIDMTKEPKDTFSFSSKLIESIKANASKKLQSLVMLNRRGYSPFFMCPDCGYTYKCPACSISLIYHKDTNTLNCHYCGSHLLPKDLCPECSGSGIKCLGTGTQRIEEELIDLIPGLAFQRMDRDTTTKKLSHHRMVKDMEDKKIDVLLGTQMVAKGHDFPDVALSAVVSADITMNMPDFRSAERAFQLFTQLAGRAGRGDVAGKAYIQTYEPEHYVFDYVRMHDYKGFFQNEIEMRKELSYPPFGKLIRVIFYFRTKDAAKRITKIISRRIERITPPSPPLGKGGIVILGPAPAPVEKIRNLWRWHIILKGKNSKSLRQAASIVLDRIKDIKELKTDIDVDPINLM